MVYSPTYRSLSVWGVPHWPSFISLQGLQMTEVFAMKGTILVGLRFSISFDGVKFTGEITKDYWVCEDEDGMKRYVEVDMQKQGKHICIPLNTLLCLPNFSWVRGQYD